MIRVLYWNIQKFGTNKINDPQDPDGSVARSEYILEDIFSFHIPDIFIIVEVTAGRPPRGNEGKVNNHGGGKAAFDLLEKIQRMRQAVDENGQLRERWYLVPPICTGHGGYEESVAVYYNARRLQFVGPYIWTQEQANNPQTGQARPIDYIAQIHDYPGNWFFSLPNRTIPDNFDCVTHGLSENRMAGQWWWKASPTSPDFNPHPDRGFNDGMCFPNVWNRKPFLTQFFELAEDQVTPLRKINIYTVHTSPTTKDRGVKKLNLIPEIAAGTPANTVDVVLGDFNVDTFNAFNIVPQTVAKNAYLELVRDNNFTMQFAPYANPYVQGTTVVNNALVPFRLTHYLPIAKAKPFNATETDPPQVPWPNPTHNVSPRLGYMGSMAPDPTKKGKKNWILTDAGAIDNVLTRYGQYAEMPANNNATIINTTSGTQAYMVPENDYPAAGILSYPTSLDPNEQLHVGQMPIDDPDTPYPVVGYPDDGSQESINGSNVFLQGCNFDLIADVSDHLPLIIEI